MEALKRIRPSNLVILATVPFFFLLFLWSEDHRRSLVEILGVEARAPELLYGFLLFLAIASAVGVRPLLYFLGRLERHRRLADIAALAGLAVALFTGTVADIAAFVNSAVANAVDPFTSDLIVKGATPFTLTPEGLEYCLAAIRRGVLIYAAVAAVLLVAASLAERGVAGERFERAVIWAQALFSLAPLFYLLFLTHLGFAAGVFVTLRAAVLAYSAAALLGLGLAGLQLLRPGRRTFPLHIGISLLLFAAAGIFFAQPSVTYVLVGTLDKEMAIVSGTPKSLVDTARHGDYDGGDGKTVRTRASATVEEAVGELVAGERVSSALLPESAAPPAAPVIWRVVILPDRFRLPATAFLVIAIFLAILTFGGYVHRRHPMSVAAEFYVDTVRGIPILVIILYVGFPLSGAVKGATAGAIDLTTLTRGIIALSIGYSAYMAEIFRAGINAVPKGQIEAARSLGLRNWHVARLVVLPQALRIIIPPLGNELIAILKDTSLLSVLSVRDVTQRMREFYSSSFLTFPPYNTLAIFYVFLTLAVASMLKWAERRHHVGGN